MTKSLSRNIIANVAQTVLGALLLFALYRYINTTLGVERLGIWSVVLATASAANLANLGLGGGVVRFIARDRARGDLDRAAQVVDTAVLTLAVLVGAVLPLLYPLLCGLLPHLFQTEHLGEATSILPYALVSMWLTILSTVLQGALDGCERMDLRAGLIIGGQLLLLPLAFWLLPQHGLIGLAWAQIVQGLFLMLGGRLMLKRALPSLSLCPIRWHKQVLLEMLAYSANIQVATVFHLLLDPITKALMAHFGSVSAAGYFEMGNQLVFRVRSLIVMANQAVVPHAAVLAEKAPDQLGRLYRQNMRVLVFVALPALTLLFTWSGGLSWLLAGAYHAKFVFVVGLLTLAWGANVFCGPAYFINLGTGRVGLITLTQVTMTALSAGLGWTFGRIFGPDGVIVAYALALVVGSVGLIVMFQLQNGLDWHLDLGSEHLPLIAACSAVVGFGLWKPLQLSSSLHAPQVAQLLAPLLLLGLVAWFHPFRKEVLAQLMARNVEMQNQRL